MNKKIRNGLYIALVGFTLFFAFRLVYGYTSAASDSDDDSIFDVFSDSEIEVKRNYASAKIRYKDAAPTVNRPVAPTALEQKYEKIARYQSRTTAFEEESKKVKSLIEGFKAVIQFEKNAGNKGYRSLNLSIGVRPDTFDAFCEQVKKIGTIKSVTISKTDKTNEFKTLNAKRASLEKIRNSLTDLKNKGGKIDEYVTLENRILEIESELQELGVSLGEFDAENEFCTIHFTLFEGQVKTISFLHRAKVAFEWALKNYALALGIVLLASLVTLLLLVIIDKLRNLNVLSN